MPELAARPRVGTLLRDWRRHRRMSQLDLALEAGVSARHLSFIETGRARPSAEMVQQLAEHLGVPLRERNTLLIAAGFAPAYGQRALEEPEMGPVRDAIARLLRAHEPYPAVVVDRHWGIVEANAGLALLVEGVAPISSSRPSTPCGWACTRRAWRPGSATSASGARICSTGSGARRW